MKTTFTRAAENCRSIAFGILCSIGIAATAHAQTTVRFGSVGGLTDAGLHLAEEFGYFKEAGLNVEMQRVANAPALTTSIATNQLDVAGISITPGLFASLSQGLNLRIVGDKQSLQPGFSATRLVVRPDLAGSDEAATVKALKGKKVAVSAKASTPYMLLVRLLQKHGMSAEDITAVELAYPNMVAALTTGAIDGAVALEPFLSQAIQSNVAKHASDLVEFVPGGSLVPLVYSENFLKNRAAAQGFMEAYIKGVRIYNDAFGKNKDKEKIIEILARRAKLDPKIVRESFPAGLDPNQVVDPKSLRAFQDFFIEQKQLRERIEVERVIDSSFAEAAIAKLGPYQ